MIENWESKFPIGKQRNDNLCTNFFFQTMLFLRGEYINLENCKLLCHYDYATTKSAHPKNNSVLRSSVRDRLPLRFSLHFKWGMRHLKSVLTKSFLEGSSGPLGFSSFYLIWSSVLLHKMRRYEVGRGCASQPNSLLFHGWSTTMFQHYPRQKQRCPPTTSKRALQLWDVRDLKTVLIRDNIASLQYTCGHHRCSP